MHYTREDLAKLGTGLLRELRIYGPNFGIGGGPNAGPDALLLAAAMMMDEHLPGLWVVLTGYEAEWIPSAAGPTPPPPCQAVALSLAPSKIGAAGIHLSFGQAQSETEIDPSLADFQLGLLADEWTDQQGIPEGRWRLSATNWVRLDREACP